MATEGGCSACTIAAGSIVVQCDGIFCCTHGLFVTRDRLSSAAGRTIDLPRCPGQHRALTFTGERAIRRGWRVASVGFLVLFVGALVQSWALSLRDALGPGPGFFPFWLSVIGSVLAVTLFVQVRAWPDDEVSIMPERAA